MEAQEARLEAMDPARRIFQVSLCESEQMVLEGLIIAVLCLVLFTVLSIVGGIFAILFRFATPILIVLLVVSLLRNMRGR